MTVDELAVAMPLVTEYQTISTALSLFDEGGIIRSMVVGTKPTVEGEFIRAVPVTTDNILYPPQMVEGIKTQLRARQDQIRQQLSDFGVTATAALKARK